VSVELFYQSCITMFTFLLIQFPLSLLESKLPFSPSLSFWEKSSTLFSSLFFASRLAGFSWRVKSCRLSPQIPTPLPFASLSLRFLPLTDEGKLWRLVPTFCCVFRSAPSFGEPRKSEPFPRQQMTKRLLGHPVRQWFAPPFLWRLLPP